MSKLSQEERIAALEERVRVLEKEMRSIKIRNGYTRLPPPAG